MELIRAARAAGRRSLLEVDGKRVLAAFGASVPRFAVAYDADAVEVALDGMQGPFAVKVLSQDILHKSEAGGVILGAVGCDAVRTAVGVIAARARAHSARVDGYLVEEMCAPGREIIIGAVHDRQFGYLIMLGLGGVFVEVLQDVAFRLCPISRQDAEAMLDELRGARLLEGYRGHKAIDREAIVDLLLKVGGPGGLLVALDGEIAELDLNPVIVGDRGATVVDARLILTDAPGLVPPSRQLLDARAITERFTPLFAPATVAVFGASTTSTTLANTFIRRMKDFGYKGDLYPIHPKASEVEGLTCYPSLAATPKPIDYAYIAIGARAIPDILCNAGGRLQFAHVISSGFGEIASGQKLQKALVEAAHAGGCRMLGPNSLGLYSPRGGVTFPADAPRELGTVGVISQSGGLGTDIIKRGQWRGLRFSGLVTIGNSADLGPADLLEFYLADSQTHVIGMYLEDVKDGRRFFEILRDTRVHKPVVILRGGRSSLGRAAAASHTGAMAGDDRAWSALPRQAPCVLVSTIDEFINALLAFQFLKPHLHNPTRKVVLFGNGGGTSVLAADAFAECGLLVEPFSVETAGRLEDLGLPPGTSVANPIDTPVATLQEDEGRVANRIFDIVYESAAPDALVMHLNLAAFVGRGGADPIDNLIHAAVNVQLSHPGGTHFVIVFRTDGSPELDERRRRYRAMALGVGIPVYDELVEVAYALRAVHAIEQHFATRLPASEIAGVTP